MKMSGLYLCAVFLAGSMAGMAQTSGTCADTVEAAVPTGSTLTLESRSAGVTVVGTDQQVIRVSCKVERSERAEDVRIRINRTGDLVKLDITGGPTNNVQIRIEVPNRTNLRAHMPAGQFKVDGVVGHKEIDLNAGQIVISGVNEQEYRSVDAGVDVGSVKASGFGVQKGGFFRSFQRDSLPGRYRLRARLISGSIELN